MKLETRYGIGQGGLRLDAHGPHAPNAGPALDLTSESVDSFRLWAREDGEGPDSGESLTLSIENIWALREQCNWYLERAGLERTITVQVPA